MRDKVKDATNSRRYYATPAGKAASRRGTDKRKHLIRDAKAKPCADCGVQYPYYVMDFDHVRGTKLFNIGEGATNFGQERLLAEIEKCDVVCANCHRERTHG